MEDIIAPINKEVLKSELTEDKRLRFTNKSHNEIYIVTWKNAPNVLKEIGRFCEIALDCIPCSRWRYGKSTGLG